MAKIDCLLAFCFTQSQASKGDDEGLGEEAKRERRKMISKRIIHVTYDSLNSQDEERNVPRSLFYGAHLLEIDNN